MADSAVSSYSLENNSSSLLSLAGQVGGDHFSTIQFKQKMHTFIQYVDGMMFLCIIVHLTYLGNNVCVLI